MNGTRRLWRVSASLSCPPSRAPASFAFSRVPFPPSSAHSHLAMLPWALAHAQRSTGIPCPHPSTQQPRLCQQLPCERLSASPPDAHTPTNRHPPHSHSLSLSSTSPSISSPRALHQIYTPFSFDPPRLPIVVPRHFRSRVCLTPTTRNNVHYSPRFPRTPPIQSLNHPLLYAFHFASGVRTTSTSSQ